MKNFQLNSSKEYLMKRLGDISQLAGGKRYELTNGKAKGVEAVDIRTGTGFQYTVLPGRGMDIAWAEYKGVPVSYISKTGVVGPAYYESEGMGWLRSFFGGLVTTCGLSNVGGPDEVSHPVVGVEKLGLHGRISNMAAGDVCVSSQWQGDRFVMTVSGYMREAKLHAENLVLKRTVTSVLGQSSLMIHDEVTNEGFTPQPLMLLYHINIGYPLLDEGSRLVCSSDCITPANALAEMNISDFNRIGPPVQGAMEQLYFHDLIPDADGRCSAALVNDKLELGILVSYFKQQLPFFSQWKQLGEAEYVVGLEPANCLPIGRSAMARQGGLESLQPGECKTVDIKISILDGHDEIGRLIG